MALVPCPECQKEVSTEAIACPQCAFPYPGKKTSSTHSSLVKLHACPDCGSPVSIQARVCPHCGVSLLTEHRDRSLAQPQMEGSMEETWLCPHCGMPYTRKVPRGSGGREEIADKRQEVTQEPPPRSAVKKDACESLVVITEPTKSPLAKRRPVLWQDSSVKKATEALPPPPPPKKFPRSRKNSVVLAIVGIILIMVAGVLGALWQFKGITPLELFAYLQM